MSRPLPSRPALKEWAAVVGALLDGRQTVLLRKGGIHEKRFAAPGPDTAAHFPLFPTTAHSHLERVRPEFQDLVSATAADSTETEIVVRAVVAVVDVVEVARPDRIAELEPFHLWTTESVRSDRLDFRPRHRLAALVVQAFPIEPVTITRTADHAGCRSWLDLDVPPSTPGSPAHSLSDLHDIASRVRLLVGGTARPVT